MLYDGLVNHADVVSLFFAANNYKRWREGETVQVF